MNDSIVVTGLGAVSVAGPGVAALWGAVMRGVPGARWVAPEVAACPASPCVEGPWRALARRMDPSGQLALQATAEAVAQAALEVSDGLRCGVILGSSRGPIEKWAEAHAAGPRLRPSIAAATTLGSATGAVAHALGAHGPTWLVSTACASGASAIAQAAEQIRLGHADVMIAGGADAPLHDDVLAGLRAAGVLADATRPLHEQCRPFCYDRSGLVPGSGAGIMVLESAHHAAQRGARVLGCLEGWGQTMEPAGLLGIEAGGLGMQRALRMALGSLPQAEIDLVHCHGTGTIANDAAEAAALRKFFAGSPPTCVATKAITGHCFGATAAMEAIVSLMALQQKRWPRMSPRGELPGLRYADGSAAPALRQVMTHAAGFWGFHVALRFSAAPDAPAG
jgi:3-oxoacyl-(acyl-carrier-protein) synthase